MESELIKKISTIAATKPSYIEMTVQEYHQLMYESCYPSKTPATTFMGIPIQITDLEDFKGGTCDKCGQKLS